MFDEGGCTVTLEHPSINLIKENSFTLKKSRSNRYSTKTTIDEDYADDVELKQILSLSLYIYI